MGGRDPFGDQPPMEMRAVRSMRHQDGPREVSGTEDFFESIASLQTDLKELQFMIDSVGDLNRRGLDSTAVEDRNAAQTESAELSDEIRGLIQSIKSQIQSFEADHSLLRQRGDPEQNLNVRTQQLAGLKKRFVETVQRYAEVEQNSRRAIKARVERQVRIVKPNATDEEVRMAVEDEASGGGAVFQQALVSSNRMGSARNALKEVQSRAEDMRRIEQTITELAQLFNDMATMVEEQDVAVQHIEKQAEVVNQDMEAATTELKTAVVSAKGARSKRKCCCILLVVILRKFSSISSLFYITSLIYFSYFDHSRTSWWNHRVYLDQKWNHWRFSWVWRSISFFQLDSFL
ncbi:t-SNARE [Melampsora americana]|nr:t-SNARE [Melampsora americana]